MVTLFDGASLSLEVAFASSASSTTWTDITAYCRSVSWSRGRQRELEQSEPGTLIVELLNSDRRFDAFYASGAYYPYVTPMRHVRLRATYAAVTYELFVGHVEDWSQSWEQSGFSICTMSAIDDMRLLARQALADAYSYEIDADSPVVYLRLGETSGALVRDSISGTLGEFRGTLTATDSLIAHASNAAIDFNGTSNRVKHSDCARVTALPLSVEAWFRTSNAGLQLIARQGSGGQNDGWSLHLFAGAIIASTPFHDTVALTTTAATFADGNTHHVVYVRSTTGPTHKIYVDGVDQATTTGTVSSQAYDGLLVGGSIKAGDWFVGPLDEVAVYDQALTLSQVLTHYAAGVACWSGDTTGLRFARLLVLLGVAGVADTGNTTLGGALDIAATSALEQLQLLTATEGGAMWIDGAGDVRFRGRHYPVTSATEFTFGDQPGEIDFLAVTLAPAADLLRNEVTVTRENGAPQVVSDAASQTAYLTQAYDRSGQLYADDQQSLYAAQWLLGRYKDPLQRVESIRASLRSDPASSYPALLALDLADKVGVNVRPSTGAVISQTSIVENFTHTVTADSWTVDVGLSPAETRAYLVVGSATLGKIGTGRFGF